MVAECLILVFNFNVSVCCHIAEVYEIQSDDIKIQECLDIQIVFVENKTFINYYYETLINV